jgi:predicted phosphodiesterase
MGFKAVKGKSIVNNTGRIIMIGDLHGCLEECLDLLAKLAVASKDTVIFLGDLVDRGPYNGGCVDLAMKHECILGNHEQKHINYYLKEQKGEKLGVLPPTHAFTRSQLNIDHYKYFENLPHFIRLPQYNSVVVHGGVFPGKAIEDQNAELLIRMQFINPANPKKTYWAMKRPVQSIENGLDVIYDDSFKFWTELWDGPERIIFGHSVLNKPLITEKAVGIDGGCAFGDTLYAFVLPDNIVVSVPSKQPNTHNPNIKLHLFHEDVGTY